MKSNILEPVSTVNFFDGDLGVGDPSGVPIGGGRLGISDVKVRLRCGSTPRVGLLRMEDCELFDNLCGGDKGVSCLLIVAAVGNTGDAGDAAGSTGSST